MIRKNRMKNNEWEAARMHTKKHNFNRKRLLLVIMAVFLGGVTILLCKKMDFIYDKVAKCKKDLQRKKEYQIMHVEKVKENEIKKIEDEKMAWYNKYHFIAHSGGMIDGKIYTNSLEAWNYSYEKKNRVFDADLAFTSDKKLVLQHAWNDNFEYFSVPINKSNSYLDRHGQIRYLVNENILKYDEFMNKNKYFKYTPMDCKMMIEYMHEHDDLYVACDTKDDPAETYEYLVNMAKKMNCEDVLNRIIVSIYDYEMYDKIKNVYPFKNITIRQYIYLPHNYYELADFCTKHSIHVVNISSCYADDEGVKLLENKGIHVYVAVIDYISDMKNYYKNGIDGAVTNCLYEDDWEFVEE